MPFVRIDALHADRGLLDALGRAVHDAMTENEPVDWSFGNGIAQYIASSDAASPPPTVARN